MLGSVVFQSYIQNSILELARKTEHIMADDKHGDARLEIVKPHRTVGGLNVQDLNPIPSDDPEDKSNQTLCYSFN